MSQKATARLIVALDFDSLAPATDMAQRLAGVAGMFKIGSQLFCAEGPQAVETLATLGAGIFLDLKFHDIPTTVAGAVAIVSGLRGVCLINVHAFGGLEMMQAARRALSQATRGRAIRPKLLGVTILTSLDAAAMQRVGILGPPSARAVKLAKLAMKASLDGAVATAEDARAIRRACGRGFLIVVPGVRPRASVRKVGKEDQARVSRPGEAIRAGADYIVVGRPITTARDPRAAAMAVAEEIEEALAPHV